MPRAFTKSNQLLKKVSRTIPLAAQTFSKSYLQYVRGCAPLFITRGRGAIVWDVDGNQYTDFINNLAANILGYRISAVDRAIVKQLQSGIAFSLPSPLEYELARLLVKYIPCAEMVRFGKNGSDVTTGAIRVARAVTGRDHVAACGYHGWHDWYIGSTTRSKGVPAATKKLTHKFIYNDIDSLKKIFKQYPEQIAAVIMEPMSYIEPQPGFLAAVKRVAHQHGALLIFDEIIEGFGRTGKMFASEHYLTPDILVLGKSLGGGITPLAGIVTREKYNICQDRSVGHYTHEKNALSATAALAEIEVIEKNNLCDHAARLGAHTLERLQEMSEKHRLIGCVMGIGLHIGIDLVRDRKTKERAIREAEMIMFKCLEKGLAFKTIDGNMITLRPALVVTREELDWALNILDESIGEVERGLIY